MSGPHTPSLLRVDGEHILDMLPDESAIVACVVPNYTPAGDHTEANALRLVACWNAFDGWTLEQIERAGKWLGGIERGKIEDVLRGSGV